MAVSGMKCIDLCNEAIKILGTYFSCNSIIKEEYNFVKIVSYVQSLDKTLAISKFYSWRGRVVVFKSLAISKIIFQVLIAPVSTHIIKDLEII